MLVHHQKSKLTGDPIRVILTGVDSKSQNPKTGDTAQIFIIPSGVNPYYATTTGKDEAVCGSCKYRPLLKDAENAPHKPCYVRTFQSVMSTWKAHRSARKTFLASLKGKAIRIGAYGDPAAVNLSVWRKVIRLATRTHRHPRPWLSYTHQWHTPQAQPYRSICMASVDSVDEQRQASAQGWRTFRVRTADQPLLPDEIICPASQEAKTARPDRHTTCSQCLLCNGTAGPTDTRKNIAIIAH